MTDRHGERIGCIVWRGQRRKTEQQLHHLLYLMFFGTAVANHGALDLGGSVLRHRQSGFDRSKHRDAASMSQFEGAARIGRGKKVLDGDTIGLVLREEQSQPGMNFQELVRKRGVNRTDSAADNHAMARTIRLDAAITGAIGARVDAKNLHASEASISFSSISKFDH